MRPFRASAQRARLTSLHTQKELTPARIPPWSLTCLECTSLAASSTYSNLLLCMLGSGVDNGSGCTCISQIAMSHHFQAARPLEHQKATPGHHRSPAGFGGKRPFNYWTVGSAMTEVEMDTLTGAWDILRADLVMDVGQSLNPAIDIGQIEGGYVQGASCSPVPSCAQLSSLSVHHVI